MIVRDEERSITRALASAAPFVDEMVVVDTGSVDATVGLAVQAGARVESFRWIDDFAAARNHALSACTGAFALVLDADEWLEADSDDVLRDWARLAPPGEAGTVLVSSETESDGTSLVTENRGVRVLPAGGRYEGRIHEQVVGYSSVAPIDGITIRHDGYLAPQTARKRGRNERLIRAGLAEAPDNLYLRFQLAKELQIDGSYGPAADEYLAVLPRLGPEALWRDDARARALYCLTHAGRTEEALAWAGRLTRSDDRSAEVVFAAGNVFLDVAVANPARHRAFVSMARSAWQACLSLGDPTDGRDFTPGCGTFLAAQNLAMLCEAEGDDQGAADWARRAAALRGI